MRTVFVSMLLFLALAGCHKSPADAPQSNQGSDCENINYLSQVMQCDLSPYASGRDTDEAAFRKALTQLREIAPSDPAFFQGAHAWPQIVDSMLQSRNYTQGCRECHQTYRKLYKDRFEQSQIPWTSVHAPVAAAK
jgi:hypothetical protein